MALFELQKQHTEALLQRFLEKVRPPESLRDQLDVGYKINNQSVTIFETHPDFIDPNKKSETLVAKATYIKKHDHWKILYSPDHLNWKSYTQTPTVDTITDFLKLVEEDTNGAFFT